MAAIKATVGIEADKEDAVDKKTANTGEENKDEEGGTYKSMRHRQDRQPTLKIKEILRLLPILSNALQTGITATPTGVTSNTGTPQQHALKRLLVMCGWRRERIVAAAATRLPTRMFFHHLPIDCLGRIMK